MVPTNRYRYITNMDTAITVVSYAAVATRVMASLTKIASGYHAVASMLASDKQLSVAYLLRALTFMAGGMMISQGAKAFNLSLFYLKLAKEQRLKAQTTLLNDRPQPGPQVIYLNVRPQPEVQAEAQTLASQSLTQTLEE